MIIKIILLSIALIGVNTTVIKQGTQEIVPTDVKVLVREEKPKEEILAEFTDNDVTIKSNINEDELDGVLQDTNMYGLAEHIIDAEREYGVNSLFLAALIAHESGWAESERSDKNNLTGFAVYSSDSVGAVFESKRENILATAKLLREDFLTEEAISFNGLSVRDINKRYCFLEDQKTIDYNWTESITSIANNLRDDINILYRLGSE